MSKKVATQPLASELGHRYAEGAPAATDARVLIYRMLAEFLGEVPDEQTVAALRAPGVATTFQEAGYDLGLELLPRDVSAAADRLAAEYGHLFVGPHGHLPPFESVHRTDERRELWGPSTQKVKRRMAAWGLAPKKKGLVPDHISCELDFMAHMAAAEAALNARGDADQAEKCRQAQRVFLDEHLGAWVPVLSRKVAERVQIPLFRELLMFTVEFLQRDRECLDLVDLPNREPPNGEDSAAHEAGP